ncbi:class I SAM-dependent methyltransferase [Micromonospora sp. R77]|uniref:class I SAM-dependent methyltransferase n=1 Tax=Micromonospora sp. R77 TaxID=2925836 RepID=UPI001F60886B|nr:class I SAM-dependent methyltransferase [Micromonospora sp. R77]MCI4065568.1 class I SAM-dependent methyltransferase [Micromonospora sp. R77]
MSGVVDVDRPDGRAYADMSTYFRAKDSLLGALSGRVLEIGAGAGANFGRFPAGIEWVGLEPDPRRRRRLARTAAEHGHHHRIIPTGAEHVPLPDDSVDAVVATIVLCSVADPRRVLSEVRRVLRPGGTFVYFEHVAAPADTWSGRLQRAVAPLTRRWDGGCRPDRQTWRDIRAAGFREVDLRWFAWGKGLRVYDPYIAGTARG